MFDEVLSPEIDKYNADQKMVDKVNELTAESKIVEVTVTYSPNMIESTETKEVNQTIHYVYGDGKEAAPDKVDTVTFTRLSQQTKQQVTRLMANGKRKIMTRNLTK